MLQELEAENPVMIWVLRIQDIYWPRIDMYTYEYSLSRPR